VGERLREIALALRERGEIEPDGGDCAGLASRFGGAQRVFVGGLGFRQLLVSLESQGQRCERQTLHPRVCRGSRQLHGALEQHPPRLVTAGVTLRKPAHRHRVGLDRRVSGAIATVAASSASA
jgi:hypothetical protein